MSDLGIKRIQVGGSTYDVRDSRIDEAEQLEVNAQELNYSKGLTSNIQTQLNSKQPALPTKVNDRFLHTNASTGDLEWSEVQSGVTGVKGSAESSYRTGQVNLTLENLGVTASATELNYTDGVTSNIQTQLDAKQATLVSGANIKTINNDSILGSGNITASSVSVSSTGTATDKVNYITVDGTEKKLGGTEVSVSATGTSTDEVKYITIDGVEKKIAGGAVTGVKGNNESTYRTGEVNLTPDNIFATSDKSSIQTTGQELNYVHGVTSSIQDQLDNKVSVSATGTSTDSIQYITIDGVENKISAVASWGSISGTLSNQTDLNTALNAKQDKMIAHILEADD